VKSVVGFSERDNRLKEHRNEATGTQRGNREFSLISRKRGSKKSC